MAEETLVFLASANANSIQLISINSKRTRERDSVGEEVVKKSNLQQPYDCPH
jgi:hypothetical protein